MFGAQQHLGIVMCEDAQDAINKGFLYRQPEYSAVEITTVVVVKNGTQDGNSSVDLILQDEQGKKFVVMLTGALIKGIPC